MNVGSVFVVGAGPAGLFATRKLASAGYSVVIFNRDIKPGGLAEYGIYPEKHHMKQGLRGQFAKILELPNVAYFGHVQVGKAAALSIAELKQWKPQAIVFAVGAQGTKKLGLPGEDAKGVYSAKDFVYHYNQLPPFASQDFSTGQRVAIVGMGNVMVDIARWLLIDMPGEKPEEVVVIARRGPFEVKFDPKEFEYIEMFLDRRGFQAELRRIEERVKAAGQDMSKVSEVFRWLDELPTMRPHSRLSFRFLTSPAGFEADATRRVSKLRVVENRLKVEEETTKAVSTGETAELDFDTVIFAIGDVVDPNLGLPISPAGYLTNPEPWDRDRAAYEVFDARTGRALAGHYVLGWARKASEGLVGRARYDAERGCTHILRYLSTHENGFSARPEEIYRMLAANTEAVVTKENLPFLAQAEAARAQEAKLPAYKFPTDAEMLAAIEEEKAKGLRSCDAAA